MQNHFPLKQYVLRRAPSAARLRQVWLAVVLCVVVGSCGYRFPGGGNLPAGVNRIFVTTLENRTRESGMETIITNDLIFQLIQNQKNAVASRRHEADAILSGVVESIRNETVARAAERVALERRVTISVSLKLTTPDGNIIWEGNGIRENETYTVTSDELRTELNKKAAITAGSKRLAERVYDRLTGDF